MTARALLPFLALAAVSAFGQNAAPKITLTVGDKAPAIKVAKWVKGEPTKQFALGKVYVVEFWATWCGPCRASIPHLTELQKKYGATVAINGIAIAQREPADKYIASVESFVKTMGPKMEYAIAADTTARDGVMSRTWMDAAGQNGIPTAFIVGKDGKIAWIGNPLVPDFDETLGEVVAGTYDVAAASVRAKQRAEADNALQMTMTTVTAAYKRDDDAAADAAMKALVAKYPLVAGTVLDIRFNRALEKGRETEAHKILREGWEAANLSADSLNEFAWALATDERIKTRDFPLAIAMATKGVELSEEKDAAVIDTLAYALFHGGKIDEAIAWQQKAVALTEGKDAGMVASLEKYKKAKG